MIHRVVPSPPASMAFLKKATDDLTWPGEGDIVRVKPALNTPDPYPSTTRPLAIRGVAERPEERGKHKVIGDQSGIEHVLYYPKGVIYW